MLLDMRTMPACNSIQPSSRTLGRNATMNTPSSVKSNPVIFIHGLWIHSSSWQPWMDLFSERGYPVSAPGWPGDGETVAA